MFSVGERLGAAGTLMQGCLSGTCNCSCRSDPPEHPAMPPLRRPQPACHTTSPRPGLPALPVCDPCPTFAPTQPACSLPQRPHLCRPRRLAVRSDHLVWAHALCLRHRPHPDRPGQHHDEPGVLPLGLLHRPGDDGGCLSALIQTRPLWWCLERCLRGGNALVGLGGPGRCASAWAPGRLHSAASRLQEGRRHAGAPAGPPGILESRSPCPPPPPSTPPPTQTPGTPFAFGVDPAWHGTRTELSFLNSMKMKMSIVLGVVQVRGWLGGCDCGCV